MKIKASVNAVGFLIAVLASSDSVAENRIPEPTPWIDKHEWAARDAFGELDSAWARAQRGLNNQSSRPAWMEKSRISIDRLECAVVDEHTLEVKGKITECQYEVRRWQERTVYRFHVSGSGHAQTFLPPYKVSEHQNTRTEWTGCMPDVIHVRMQDLTDWPETNITVQSDGAFAGFVKANDKWFVKRPLSQGNKYFSVFNYENPIKLYIYPEYSSERVIFEPQTVAVRIWFWKIDEHAIKRYVSKTEPLIRLKALDELSRTPISARFKITGINVPSKGEVSKLIEEEFKDPAVLKLAVPHIVDYLGEGSVTEKEGEIASFRGIAGATYKIETFQKDYLYFSQELKLPAQEVFDNEILLKERPR